MSAPDNLQVTDVHRMLSVRETAVRLGVSVRSVWRMIADHQLRVCRIRRCTRIPLTEILNHLKDNGRIEA